MRETARTAVAAPYDVVVTTKFTRDVAPIRQTCSVDLGKRSRGDWLGIDSTEDLVSP